MMTRGNLLDFSYHQNYYHLNDINFSRQTNRSISQLIRFIGTFEEYYGGVMFFIPEKKQKNYSKLFFRLINCNRTI